MADDECRVCKESSELCHSFLVEIDSKRGLELLLWHLSPEAFFVRSCSVCLMLRFQCFCLPRIRQQILAASPFLMEAHDISLVIFFSPAFTDSSELALGSWYGWLYHFWDFN